MKLAPLLLTALWLAASTFAAAPAPATHDYLVADAFNWHALIPPPPAEDSIAAQGEHEIALQLDAHRTPEQVALARRYAALTVFTLMADVLGPWCTAENLPRTHAVFMQAYAESRPVLEAAKVGWNRRRPYDFNPALQPAVEKPINTSYPSGHSFTAAWYAVLLSAVLPDHAADWEKEAQLVRWSRMVGGAHYPSDVIAGKLLGEAVGREMLKSPKLQQALEEIRAELAPFLAKKAA